MGLEPTTSGFEVQRAIHCATRAEIGEEGHRSLYLADANGALYHLSYIPGFRTKATKHIK